MKNGIQDGKTLDITAPYAVLSGGMVKVGTIIGVAITDIASGSIGTVERSGVYEVVKTTGEAWAVGDKIYWDNTAKSCTTTASGNTLCGAATEIAASGATVGRVFLDGVIR